MASPFGARSRRARRSRIHPRARRRGRQAAPGDLWNLGEQRSLRFGEKSGKVGEIPVRSDLDAWLREYLVSAGQDGKMPLFRSAGGKLRQPTAAGYAAHSIRQTLKRRLTDAGLPHIFSPHSFRVTVVTDLLNENVPLEDVRYLAGHSNPSTTQTYDRRRRRLTRNVVERISIYTELRFTEKVGT